MGLPVDLLLNQYFQWRSLKVFCFYLQLSMIFSTLVLISVGIIVSPSIGTPISNTNETFGQTKGQHLVGYVADPSGRGTSSLVLSCLLTLILCVWSALHLNVPPPAQSRLQSFWLNVRWIVVGIYTPEFVVFTAWRQWSSARILSGIVRAQNESHKLDIPLTRDGSTHRTWTSTHSFFACTGGFAFDARKSGSGGLNTRRFLPEDIPERITITARGISFLAKCGYLPNVPKEDIADKSKANDLAKVLVVLQASWLLVQVIARLLARLPVTLLEVNTVAHVLCAFSMYATWWNKPLTAKEPIILQGEWAPSLLAFMYLSSEMSGRVDQKQMQSQTAIKTLLASLKLYSKTPEIESLCFTACASNRHAAVAEHSQTCHSQRPTLWSTPTFQSASEGCANLLKARKQEKEAATAFFERRPRINAVRKNDERIDELTARRWNLAVTAVEEYTDVMLDCVSFTHETDSGPCVHFKSQQLVASHSRNWPGDDLLRNVNGLVVGMILWLANFLYGAIHAAAWNEHFPSTAEKWLWRVSASYIGFCGGLWVALNYIVSSNPRLNEFWEKWMDGEKKWWHNVLLGTPVLICGLGLMVARVYIVVEAFLSIRELPEKAYETPTWAQIFPHF